MNNVDNNKITEWGCSFKNRKNTFDDELDIRLFKKLVGNSKPFAKYLRKFLKPEKDVKWVNHPDGPYGIDLAIVSNDKKIAVFDLERWSKWGNDWPNMYKYCSFLGRKDKYLSLDVPFFMVWTNKYQNKFLVCDGETIKKYPVKKKYFAYHNRYDLVRMVGLSRSILFSNQRFGDLEQKHFKCIDTN